MAVDYFSNPPPALDLDESRTASNNAIAIVLFALSALFVGLRLLTRLRYQAAPLGLDDYLMFLGLAFNAGNLACCIVGGFYGLGKHIWSLGPHEMRQISVITFEYVFIYAWSVCIIKYSIIALYRRIFGMSLLGWWCVFLTTGYLVANHIVLPLYTKPLSYYWNQWQGAEGVVQVNEAKFYLGVGVINLFGDMCILAVPVRSVLKLQMGTTQKIAVTFMFMLGSFVCFASLYRIITIVRLVHSTDISWAKSDVFIWSSVEPSIGIISGCLPTLRPLLLHELERVFKYAPSSHQRSSSAQASHSNTPLETISKKRTRKIGKKDVLNDSQFTQLGDEGGDLPGQLRRLNSQPGAWRQDDDEVCLTSTTVKGVWNESSTRVDLESLHDRNGHGITMTKEFDLDEDTRR